MIYTFKLISHPSRPMVVTFGAKVKTQPSFPFKNAFILLSLTLFTFGCCSGYQIFVSRCPFFHVLPKKILPKIIYTNNLIATVVITGLLFHVLLIN